MTDRLTIKDIIALGFMTFALFVGAGNIIFPPVVGIQSGEHICTAAIGFLITSVGLPICTIIAVARAGGGIEVLSKPIGKTAGTILAMICYLLVGPLFAIPRTANVSFEVGIVPILNNTKLIMLLYSFIYFILIVIMSLYPSKLIDIIGYFLAPIKIIALSILGLAALIWPAGKNIPANIAYQTNAFSLGFINGYLTMDTLGALVFSMVIVNAIRARGISNKKLLANYTIIAGLIAGIGLTLVYISLFRLGNSSGVLVSQNVDGASILHAYVQSTFGKVGSIFLMLLMFIACIVTAIGLTCAWANFFSQYINIPYKLLVYMLSIFSMIISNLGLDLLIKGVIPILTIIYPPCIVLVILSFTVKFWNRSNFIFIPTMLVSLIFSVLDSIKHLFFLKKIDFIFNQYIPLSDKQFTWLIPTVLIFIIFAILDRIKFFK
ncbi:MAG: branched-chain amino acid transport system II carrier protein [Pantoea sp. Brub]|nr:branched-chain amino acid transport system II carrier protein [Pantoea sp. Brub]